MKKIILAFLLFAGINTFAQELPVDSDTKLITYSEVVTVAGTNQAELYKRALAWVNAFYPNPAGTIKKQEENSEIECQARFKIFSTDKKGVKIDAGYVSYTLKLMLKDSKYKYEITNINWKQTSYYPIERWNDKTASFYDPVQYPSYLQQVDEYMKDLVSKLKTRMAEVEKKKKEDW